MIKALSHLVIATNHVGKMEAFFQGLFGIASHFSNSEFVEFVLPSKARIAFFKPVGKSAKYFRAEAERDAISLGVTVDDVEMTYQKAVASGLSVSGPPKEHPWGEKSFLATDPDGNRWEITASPSADGLLVNLESKPKGTTPS